MDKTIQAKDVDRQELLQLIRKISWKKAEPGQAFPSWVMNWDLAEALPQIPFKVVLAKLRRLENQGYLGGCACGCRGDWRLEYRGLLDLGEEILEPLDQYYRMRFEKKFQKRQADSQEKQRL